MSTDTNMEPSLVCSVEPMLSVRNGARAVEFYQAAFGAREVYRVEDPVGAVVSRLSVEGAEFWLSDESPEHGSFSPESLGGGSVRMILTVRDPDAVFAQALAAGAREVYAVEEAHGWRLGRVVDPFGHHWEIGRPLVRRTSMSLAPLPEPEGANLADLSDLCTPWCVHVVATLRIAEHLAAGIDRIDALAAATGCDADALHRVLRHLVGKGVFQEVVGRRFALNDAARGLLDPGQRMGLDLDGIGGRLAYAWGSLLTLVRTGKPAYQEIFGRPFWEDLEAHPDIAASFDALMGTAGHGTPDPEILLSGDWESVSTVVDVGGGTGAMLTEILKAHPAIRGTLVDRPQTVARSGATFQAAGVSERVTTIGQSFFDPLPAGADLYVLKSILNDWPDREARAILSRCAVAAHPGGRIVILGGVSPEEDTGLIPEMVLLGGKSRTVAEFRELARAVGMEVGAAGRQPSGRFVVECRPT